MKYKTFLTHYNRFGPLFWNAVSVFFYLDNYKGWTSGSKDKEASRRRRFQYFSDIFREL